MTRSEKFQLAYGYVEDLRTKKYVPCYSKKLKKIVYDKPDVFRMFTYMVDLFDYNSFPQIVDDETFKSSPGPSLYRGCENNEHMARLLFDHDYHYGCGLFTNGIYATDDYYRALLYANDENQRLVMGFRLADNARVIDIDSLYKYSHLLRKRKCKDLPAELYPVRQFLESMGRKQRQHWCWSFYSDPAKLAIMLGYDAIRLEASVDLDLYKSPDTHYDYAILNRGKMIISESTAKKISENSRLYKDGMINYDDKNEEDFLRE